MTPQTLQVIQQRFDQAARAKAVGYYSLVLSLGVLAGQLVGGVIVTTAGWRWALLINVPVGVLLLIASRRTLKAEPAGHGKPLDLLGVSVLTAAMALILIPLLLGREQGWPAWIWPSLAAGIGGIALLARVERRPNPLLDLTVLPEIARGLIAVAGVMGGYGALVFCLTLHLQDDLGYSPLHAGLAFAPYAAGFALISVTGRRIPSIALGTGALLVATLPWSPLSEVILFVAGAGHASGFSPVVARTVASVKPAHAAEASSLLTTGSLLAQVLAIATIGSLYLAQGLTAAGIAIAAVGAVAAASQLSAAITSPTPRTSP
jgi:hypothetical protein